MKKIITLIAVCMIAISSWAYSFKVDGIYYNITDNNTVEVTYLYTYTNSYSGSTIVIPASVTHSGTTYSVTGIGSYAFKYCDNLTTVTIPNSVTYIGTEAFRYCDNLTTVAIPNSVTKIGTDAFNGCSGMTSVSIDSNTILTNSTSMQSVFGSQVSQYTLGSNVESIGKDAFRNCTCITSIDIPAGVTSIGETAFLGCTSLTHVKIGSGVQSIGIDAFSGCTNLANTEIVDLAAWCNISFGGRAANPIYYTKNLLVDNQAVTDLEIPSSVTAVGAYAFFNCSSLTSVKIPTNVSSIGDYAFAGCSGIMEVTLPEGLTDIGSSAFINTGMNSITVPKSTSSVGSAAFSGIIKCYWLPTTPPTGYKNAGTKVNYVSNYQYSFTNASTHVYSYLSSMFEVDDLKYIPVSPSERTCDLVDCAYDVERDVSVGSNVSYKGVIFSVKALNEYAFYNVKGLSGVSFESNITEIPTYAFYGCSSLSQLTIPAQVNSIGVYAFSNCDGVKELTISDRQTILALNGSAKQFNSSPLEMLYIGGNLEYSESYIPFKDRTTLKTLVIGDNATKIGANAFSGCSSIECISIGKGMKSIGTMAFADCQNIVTITSTATTPPTCSTQALTDINKFTCTLKVPSSSLSLYQSADQWKDFLFVEPTAIQTVNATDNIIKQIAPNKYIRNGRLVIRKGNKEYDAAGKLLK